MHVHNAAPGVNGPVVFGQIGPAHDANFGAVINPSGSTTVTGLWDAGDGGVGIGAFSAGMAAAAPGNVAPLYWNIHTSGFPGGEIRGQWVCISDDFSNNVAGTAGPDILPGLMGNDTLNGFAASDRLLGGDHQDKLSGGNGNDTLNGGNGKDTLRGDFGGDSLAGTGGKDKFVFQNIAESLAAAPDEIFDFNPFIGEQIDVSAIDANLGLAGDQAFFFVAGFSGAAGQAVRTYFAGPNITTLELDQNGDAVADFHLVIRGNHAFAPGFVL